MTLTPDQVKELKGQLYEQVENLPEPNKSQAKKQIEEMSSEALEELVKQQQERNAGNEKTIFRMIIDKEVDSIKVGEDDSAIAVLEINPISTGHVIIIPKEAISENKNLPAEVFKFAEKVADKLTKGLVVKTIEMQTETKFGEKVIHLIPIYDSPLSLNSPRKKAKKEELEDIAKKLEPKPKKEVIKIETQKTPPEKIQKLKRRIP